MIASAIAGFWALVYAAAATTAIARERARVGASHPTARHRDGQARDGSTSAPETPTNIVLVRPCCGLEPGLATRLCHAPGADRVVFALGSAEDDAIRAAFTAAFELNANGVEARVLVTHARGPNHKADQLARVMGDPFTADATIVAVADSDVDLSNIDLRALASPLTGDRSAAVAWAPPVEVGPVLTLGDAVSHAVLDGSMQAFPLLAGIDPGSLVGKLFAVRRDALERSGGFDAIRSHLGEDVELARRLRLHGEAVAIAPFVAPSHAAGRSLARIVDRYTRWLHVVRLQRAPLLLSYPLLIAAGPLAATLFAIGLARHDAGLAGAGALGLAVRWVIACAARRSAGLPLGIFTGVGQAAIADIVLLVALVRSLVTRTIRWRDRALRFGTGPLETVRVTPRSTDAGHVARGSRPARAPSARSRGLDEVRGEARAVLEKYLERRLDGIDGPPPVSSGIRAREGAS